MSNWLEYDEFIDRIRSLHHEGFTGLVTGLSDSKHSFQVGFENGDIILLAYRISKGSIALDKLVEIESAKISVHPTTQVPSSQASIPNTGDILARLTSNTSLGDTELDYSDDDLEEPEDQRAESGGSKSKTSNSKLKKAIESAAIHHFGPIAAMICEEYLEDNKVSGKNYKVIMAEIASDVGANKSDMEAFINSVTNP